jgi:hypothetical protein
MKRLILLAIFLFGFIINAFAFEKPQGRISTRYYGGTTYVTLEFKTTGSPYEGRFGCGTPADDTDLSHGFYLTTIGSNGIPSVQMNVDGSSTTSAYPGAEISYILQTSYSQPGSCPYGNDLWFITFSWSGSVYTLHDAVKLINTGTPSSPVWNIPFIAFPLSGLTPYTATISAVVDHSVSTGFNCADNVVTAYTGEEGSNTYSASDWSTTATGSGCSGSLYGWAQSDPKTAFDISGQYDTSAGNEYGKFLFYDGHTGYDYPAADNTDILSVADGIAYHHTWGPNNIYHDIKVVHDNGYTSYYLHTNDNQSIVYNSESVSKGQHIAEVGSGHLHLTVTNEEGYRVDPYGWTGDLDGDPLQRHGHDSTRIWD